MQDPFHWAMIGRFFGVAGTNLILSGDNAMVIALAVRGLQGRARRRAIFWGASGAIGLRLIFALVVTLLLSIPFLRVVGGILLFWIAWQLVRGEDEDENSVRAGSGLWDSIKIIILADAVMSLDNVIALVGVSNGNVLLLGIGLVLTIPLIIWGATLLSTLIDRFPILAYGGAALLAWIALGMIFEDEAVHEHLANAVNGSEALVKLLGAAAFVAATWLLNRRQSKAPGSS